MHLKEKEVVITGMGVLSPVGVEKETFWNSLCEGRSGVGRLRAIDPSNSFQVIGAELPDFHAKDFVKPRKNIKVMSREIQAGFVAAVKAAADAGIRSGEDVADKNVEPDRIGVVFGCDLIGIDISEVLDAVRDGISTEHAEGYDFSSWGRAAMNRIFPLWMLKYLPNMPASHIAIALDARGPSNTPTLCRGSGLASVMEGVRIIQRGAADVMVCGSCGSHVSPVLVARSLTVKGAPLTGDPESLPRPFDMDRCGTVIGEGAGAVVLESRTFAEARGANILATVRGFANTYEAGVHESKPSGVAMRRAIQTVMNQAGITATDLSHVNAEGLGTVLDDTVEANVIAELLGDVPVTTQKGNCGELGSGTGVVELAATLLSLQHQSIPPVRNHDKTATDCPIRVVHGQPLPSTKPFALKLNQSKTGSAFALLVQRFEV